MWAEGVSVCWWQVYKISIGAACKLSWPTDRFVIQVLDDSTDLVIKVCMLLLPVFPFLFSRIF